MKQLAENIFIDADPYCYTVYERYVVEKEESKNFGQEKFRPLSYHSTVEQVSRSLKEMGIRKYINHDWLDCVTFVTEAHDNFVKHIDELTKKRK